MARMMSVGPKTGRASIEEHRDILKAIKDKDPDKAEWLANQHIMKVMENLHMEN